ncbi:hypothetical protein BKA93DRAFT_754471 [Sparassis latifolia]
MARSVRTFLPACTSLIMSACSAVSVNVDLLTPRERPWQQYMVSGMACERATIVSRLKALLDGEDDHHEPPLLGWPNMILEDQASFEENSSSQKYFTPASRNNPQ